MGIKHEFFCMAHGSFESEEAICPVAQCTTVEKRYYTPRGIATGSGARIDKTFEMLAGDFGLSDMNTHGGTTAARLRTKQQIADRNFADSLKTRFGKMGKSVASTLAEHKAPPANTVNEIKPQLPSVRRQVVATRDPDSDSRKKVMNS